MDQESDLFVQAFWVKCREVIRPQIDSAISALDRAGYDANVATHEASDAPDGLPANAGPLVTLTLRSAAPSDAATIPQVIEFRGDVKHQLVEVRTVDGREKAYELAALGAAEVKAEIREWLTRLAISARI